MKLLIIFTILLIFFPHSNNGVGWEMFSSQRLRSSSDWCYVNSPSRSGGCSESDASSAWSKDSCTKKRQSGIDIMGPSPVDAAECPIDFGLTPVGAYNLKGEASNNGHTVVITPSPTDAAKAKFRWPAKDLGEYTLVQFHFHWGIDDSTGSEHLIGGKQYPLEAHLVHYRSGGSDSFKDAKTAIDSAQGNALAVIGIMFEVGGSKNPLEGIQFPISSPKPLTKSVNLDDIIRAQKEVYHYEGSLTTPPCSEIVQWLVLKDPVQIPKDVLVDIRKSIPGSHTFRKVQALEGRKITTLEISV